MTNNSRRPYEWGAVVNWTLSLFLMGLTTTRTPFSSGMDRFALGLFSGIVWAAVGGLIVAAWKYFKRSPVPDRAKAVESEKVNDKALFIVAMVIAAFLFAKGLYLETYGSLVDAVILLALGFGVRAGLHPARWLFAVYAFVTPILVIANGGGNAVIWPFVFYGVCRSLVNQGNGRFVHDTTTMNHRFPDTATQTSHIIVPTDIQQEISAPLSNETQKTPTSIAAKQAAFVDEDRVYAQIAEELETGIADKGLWTRLFAECSGDEKQTKVLYIKQRAERLIEAEKARIEFEARERATEAERKEKLRLEGLSLREKLASQNISKELAAQIADLSRTYDAVALLNRVRLNQQDDVLALLNQNPLLVAVSNSEGDTALHIALREKYAGMVRLLIEKGARAEIPNAYGVTPVELASKSGQPELVSLLAVVA